MKALIVDGEELFRLSMREVVSVSTTFNEIIEAGSESEFISVTAKHDSLDLVVVHPNGLGNSNSPQGSEEGRNCLNLVKRLYPSAAIVIITDNTQIPPSWQGTTMVGRGASVSTIVNKIRRSLNLPTDTTAQAPTRPATPNVRAFMHDNLRPTNSGEDAYVDLGRLSFRQKQILAMAADGLPNKEIAARLGIAEGTVKAHMHAIFKVLDVSNRTQAVIKYGALNQIVAPAGGLVHQSAM